VVTAADVVDLQGKPAAPNQEGFLIIRRPWPSIARTLWRDPERYKQQYWERVPGLYLAGDAARMIVGAMLSVVKAMVCASGHT
jgi:acetyl-CoA synthetase